MTPLETAEARAAAAKARLQETVGELQDRLQPRSLVRTAADSGRELLAEGADRARANPGRVVGAVALVTAVLARHRIAALVRKATGKKARRFPRSSKDPVK